MPKNASTTAASASTTRRKGAAKRAHPTKEQQVGDAAPDKAVQATARKAGGKAPGRAVKKPANAKAAPVAPATPPVPEGTDWSSTELAEVRGDLQDQLTELRDEYERAIADLNDLQQTSNDGAGDDQADAGTKTFEREQEMSIAHNRLELLTQIERALERLDAGTYGRCESCGNPIAKARLQAFPSATLCVACKQREERR